MRDIRLTKYAEKQLKKLKKSDVNTARRIKKIILSLKEENTTGEALQGHSKFLKIRIGKYRLIHTTVDNEVVIALIEKRETIYRTYQHLYCGYPKTRNFS